MQDNPALMPYYRTREYSVALGGQMLRVVSKPGLPDWDRVSPAVSLLADAVEPSSDARVLLLGCGRGALGAFLAQLVPEGTVCLSDSSCIALSMSALTLKANAVANARVHSGISMLPEGTGTYDIAVMVMPKGRALARRWLVEAHTALKPEGRLYLAGATREGIKSVIKDAEALFGSAQVLGYRKRSRVARVLKELEPPNQPEWAKQPGISPGTWHEFQARVREMSFHLESLPGVFSYQRLDDGTSLLLDQFDVPSGSQVLDVGCGYGIIGLAAARMGAARVDMVDASTLAVAAAQRSIRRNGITNARALVSDALSAVSDERYHLVVTNPPFHVGKPVDHEAAHAFIEHARYVLRPGGRLLLVANRFIRYDRFMRAQYGRVECLAETGRYHVLEGFR